MLRLASDAAYALGELAALGRTMSNPHLLIGPFIRREAVLSSRIEGTQQVLEVTYHSAQRSVEKLVQAGILAPAGQSTSAKSFVASEILAIVGEHVQ